jgi:hypothetical protein
MRKKNFEVKDSLDESSAKAIKTYVTDYLSRHGITEKEEQS